MAASLALCGCEYLLVATIGSPPIGPWGGHVYDARTGLPIGGATVIADWAPSTTSNPDGGFMLGNLIPAGHLTVARAGYVSQTRTGQALINHPDVFLEPRHTATSGGQSVGIGLGGVVTSANRPLPGAQVTFTAGGQAFAKSAVDGRYQLMLRFPSGNVASGMVAGGPTVGGADGQGPTKPLRYAAFGYRPVHVGPGDHVTNPANNNLNLAVGPMSGSIGLSLTNPPLPVTTVEVFLDFGLLGQVLVHRDANGGGGTIPVPANGLQYQVKVTSASETGELESTTVLKLAGGAQAQIDFLPPPAQIAPPNQSVGNSTEPVFAWYPVPGAALYAVDVYEDKTDAMPIWQGLTDQTSIQFPFNPRNLNDAALKRSGNPEVPFFYTWTVTALEARTAEAILTNVGGSSAIGRESAAKNWGFAL